MSNSNSKKNVLIIKSSTSAEYSVSSEIADFLVNELGNNGTVEQEYQFTIRDLAQSPAPLLNTELVQAFYTPQESLNAEQLALVAPSLEYINELKNADIIVIASAMHNFSITGLLKAYIDQICRMGLTFQYTAEGPQGLLKNKKAILITTSGMAFDKGHVKAMDFQTPYLQHILNFIGVEDVRHISIAGLAHEDAVPKIKEAAKSSVKELVETEL